MSRARCPRNDLPLLLDGPAEVHRAADGASAVIIGRAAAPEQLRRYHAIRIFTDGRATCIGREVDLRLARRLAKRPPTQDGQPID